MPPENAGQLTPKEVQVFAQLGQGRTSKEVAFQLNISIQTVGNHRKSLCRKLGVHSTAELIARAAVASVGSRDS